MTVLSIATFNLNNLQRPGEPIHQGISYSAGEYKRKLAWTAQQIQTLDADIIGFQELWHEQCLTDAFHSAGLADRYDWICHAPEQGMAVALALRKPLQILQTEWIRRFPAQVLFRKKPPARLGVPDYGMRMSIEHFSRPVLAAKIRPYPGSDIMIYVAHLKSKLAVRLDAQESADPRVKTQAPVLGRAMAGMRRMAEAAALRVIMNQVMSENACPVVLMGDFNDSLHSDTLEVIAGQSPYAMLGATELPALAGVPESRAFFSHLYEGKPVLLDHIFLSEHFSPVSYFRQWMYKGIELHTAHLKQTNPAVSDHGLLRVHFQYAPMRG